MREPGAHRDAPIAVFLLTGFLGSGKTSLLNRMLQVEGPRTAVIVNEFGDVPIDNELFKLDGRASDLIETSTGCICCEPGNDIVSTLSRLSEAIDDGEVRPVDRVVVETTGLADPAPIINAMLLAAHRPIAGRYFQLAGVITTFDALRGEQTVEERLVGQKQLAFADRIAVTKSDLLNHEVVQRRQALHNLIARVNPGARVIDIQDPLAQPFLLLSSGSYGADGRGSAVEGWLAAESPIARAFALEETSRVIPVQRHSNIYTKSVVLEGALATSELMGFIDILRHAAGRRLLRLKGLVALSDDPHRPMVIHIVQDVFHRPVRLHAWPTEDRRTRLVLIAEGIDELALEKLLATLDRKPRGKASTKRRAPWRH